MSNFYVASNKYTAVTQWSGPTTPTVGAIVRQLATPAVGSERCFRAITVSGPTGSSEPTWNLTALATTTDGGVTWQECTGQAIYNGDGGGSSWGAPHARLANAFAAGWMAAGDTAYVSNNHAETQASSITLTSPGTAAAPCDILCVSDTAALPPGAGSLATTAAITTTGTSSITPGSFAYYYGIKFIVGTTGGGFLAASNNNMLVFDTCTVSLAANTNSAGVVTMPGASAGRDSIANFTNCTFLFGNAGQKIQPAFGHLNLINCAFATSGTVPTSLMGFNSNDGATLCTVRDCDLSAITNSLVNVSVGVVGDILFENCKLHSGVAPTTGAFTSLGGCNVRMHDCDSAATEYRMAEANYAGSTQTETTIVKAGGASDGTTTISYNVTTTANAKFVAPYLMVQLGEFNTTTAATVTATVDITSNSVLTNGDIWMVIEYAGDPTSPLGSLATNRKSDILASASTLPSSSATWGGSTTSQQKLVVTFTPQLAGVVKARIYVARPGLTVYVDPKLQLA